MKAELSKEQETVKRLIDEADDVNKSLKLKLVKRDAELKQMRETYKLDFERFELLMLNQPMYRDIRLGAKKTIAELLTMLGVLFAQETRMPKRQKKDLKDSKGNEVFKHQMAGMNTYLTEMAGKFE